MIPSEIREKSDVELAKITGELSEEIFKLRFRKGAGLLKQFANIKKTKHDLARVNTILRERKIGKETETHKS